MLKIRVATTNDSENISRIYNYYINNTNISFEYAIINTTEIENRMRYITEKYPYIVAEIDGEVIGYAYASQFRSRIAYSWDVELSIYVHHLYIGRGIGTRLYTALIHILKYQNFVNLYAGIALPNSDSIAMHIKLGFNEVGTYEKVGYKNNHWIDVKWYQKNISNYSKPKHIICFSSIPKNEIQKIILDSLSI